MSFGDLLHQYVKRAAEVPTDPTPDLPEPATPSYDPTQAFRTHLDDHLPQRAGTQPAPYTQFEDRVMGDQDFVQHYQQQLGLEDATTPEARQQILRQGTQDYFGQQLPQAQDPNQLGTMAGQAMRLAEAQPEVLDKLRGQIRAVAQNWDEEQREAFRAQMTETATPRLLHDAARLSGINPGEIIEATLSDEVNARTKQIREATHELATNPESGMGWGEWLTDNWQALALPAGLIATLFGTNTVKTLGLMAMAAGGYNLYERYNRLTDEGNKFNQPIIAGIQAAAGQQDADGNPAPFSDVDTIARQVAERHGGDEDTYAAVRTGLRDYHFLATQGFAEQLIERSQSAADQFVNDIFMRGNISDAPQPNWTDNVADRLPGFVQQGMRHIVPGGVGRGSR